MLAGVDCRLGDIASKAGCGRESMRKGHASRTAEFMALFRALESSLPETSRLFDDPFARTFLTWPLTIVARLTSLPYLGRLLPWIIDYRVPGARSSAIARTKFIDDAITASLAEQIDQLVILGAGFDSRAYRIPGLRRISVFEVDHPDTLLAKRRVLERTVGLPGHLRFVPTDFNLVRLDSDMVAAGYRESARTFFLWEGVTSYLSEEAVDNTLRWCSRASPGSQLLFTYVHRDVLVNPRAFFGTEKLFASLAKFGETWTFGIEPSALPKFLADRGLLLEVDLGATEYRALYRGDAARRLRGYEFYRIARARVAEHDAQDAAAVAGQRRGSIKA
jgi:methyltransferase (TIGR00027 family)